MSHDFHGNRFSARKGDAMRLLMDIPDLSVDAIITDPPYSSGGMFRGDRTKSTGDKYVVDQGQEKAVDFMGDNRDQRSFAHWCALWFAECHRLATDGAILAVFIDWRQLPAMTDAIQAGGWIWRGIVPWNKTEATRPSKGWFRSQCEYLVVGAKGKPAMLDITGKTDAPCLPGFFVCPIDRERTHQTQKPLDLMRYIVSIVRPGGTVLDPFMGSGTTGHAALAEGRRFIGFEQSDEIFAGAVERLRQAESGGVQGSFLGE